MAKQFSALEKRFNELSEGVKGIMLVLAVMAFPTALYVISEITEAVKPFFF